MIPGRALLVAAVVACSVSVPAPARAQQPALPVAPVPQHLEAIVPDAPVRMRADDAARLRPAPPARAAAAAPAVRSGGASRTIQLESPPVVNGSSQFQFRDQTERPDRMTLPLPVRRAAVETYRQSLAKGKRR